VEQTTGSEIKIASSVLRLGLSGCPDQTESKI
jgi:hypothetical protein